MDIQVTHQRRTYAYGPVQSGMRVHQLTPRKYIGLPRPAQQLLSQAAWRRSRLSENEN